MYLIEVICTHINSTRATIARAGLGSMWHLIPTLQKLE